MKTPLTAIVIVLGISLTATAADWANWRGPNYNGSTQAAGLPADFSKDRHVLWSVDLPGPAGATPIVFGDRVFISSVDVAAEQLVAMCLDRETGKVLWRDNAGSGRLSYGEGSPISLQGNNPVGNTYSNYASPSPVTDGEVVVFFYGNGDLTGYTLDGKRLWSRNIQADYGDFAFQWTFAAGPMIYEGRLFLPVLQRNEPAAGGRGRQGAESFLLSFEPKTGKEIWRHVRKSDAIMESLESYGTPIPYEHNGRKQLMIAGGDYITGHDPETGRELWRWGSYNPDHREQWWRLVPSPVAGDGVAVVCAPKRAPAYAVRVPGSEGEEARLLWSSEDNPAVASDVPTPAFADGSFFFLNDQRPRALSRVNPKTGEALWTTELPGRYLYRASPTVADGKVYCMNYASEVVVIDAADGKILHTAEMGDEDQYAPSSIAIAHNRLFIRTQGRLYCIGR